jgi:hypothetical protein
MASDDAAATAAWTAYLDGLDELIAWTEAQLDDDHPEAAAGRPDAAPDPTPPTGPPPRPLRQRSEDARRRLVDVTYRAELRRAALAKALTAMPKHQQQLASAYGASAGTRVDITS